MRWRDIRLALLAVAIVAGMAVSHADRRDMAHCAPCGAAVETS